MCAPVVARGLFRLVVLFLELLIREVFAPVPLDFSVRISRFRLSISRIVWFRSAESSDASLLKTLESSCNALCVLFGLVNMGTLTISDCSKRAVTSPIKLQDTTYQTMMLCSGF